MQREDKLRVFKGQQEGQCGQRAMSKRRVVEDALGEVIRD